MADDQNIHQQTEASDSQTSQQDYNESENEEIKEDIRLAGKAGVLSAVIVLAGAWLVGEVSGYEARVLLNTTLETTRSFCGTVTLALGNILALMLTLLSLSASADITLNWTYYQRVRQVAWFDTITLIGAILIYLLLNVPLEQSDTASESVGSGFANFYYIVLLLSSILGGALIAVVVLLYTTVRDIIDVLGHKDTHKLVRTEEEEEE